MNCDGEKEYLYLPLVFREDGTLAQFDEYELSVDLGTLSEFASFDISARVVTVETKDL